TSLREILAHTGAALKIRLREPGVSSPDADAFQLFMQGQQRLARQSQPGDTESAEALFRRATALYPRCARCYLGLGEALALQDSPPETFQARLDQAATAYD